MSKIKILAGIFLFLTSFTFTSCDNEPIDPNIDLEEFNGGGNSTGAFTAKVGTDNFNANQLIEAEYVNTAFGTQLNIVGVSSTGKTMSIIVHNPTIGTRNASSDLSSLLSFSYASSANDLYSNINSATSQYSGTLTITEFNLTTKKLSGTFSYTAYGALSSSTQIQVTEGKLTNISFENTTTGGGNNGGGNNGGGNNGGGNSSVVGSYKLTAFNTSVPTDLNLDGTASTNQMDEISCLNNSFLTINANNTFTSDAEGVDIEVTVDNNGVEVESIVCYEDAQIAGTWVLNGNTITFTYTEEGEVYSDTFTIQGNTLKYVLEDGQVVGVEENSGAPVYLNSDITLIYTKQ